VPAGRRIEHVGGVALLHLDALEQLSAVAASPDASREAAAGRDHHEDLGGR
jgi:hypothetical protein